MVRSAQRVSFIHSHTHSPDPSLIKCLSAASNADGAAVVLGDCASANAQWTVPKGAGNAGTLQIFGDKVCFLVPHRDKTKAHLWYSASTLRMAPPPTGTSSRSGPAPPQTLVRSLLGVCAICSPGPDQLFVPHGIVASNGNGGTVQWSGTNKVRWRGLLRLFASHADLAGSASIRPTVFSPTARPCVRSLAFPAPHLTRIHRYKSGTATRPTAISSGPPRACRFRNCASPALFFLLLLPHLFLFTHHSSSPSFTIAPKSATSLCVAASSAVLNASVVLAPCTSNSGSAAFPLQHWQDPSAVGHLMILSPTLGQLCAAPLGSTAASGTKLVLQVCDAQSNAQRWGHHTGNIVSALTAHDCLDLTDGKAVAGTPLQIWGCGFFGGVDNTNQDWVVSDTF